MPSDLPNSMSGTSFRGELFPRLILWTGILCLMTGIFSVLIWFMAYGYGAGVEQFIPIGHSPGVSGTLSTQGRIEGLAAGPDGLTALMLVEGERTMMFTHTAGWPIYCDRSHVARPNTVCDWRDVRTGLTAEVYPDHWIKIRME